MAVPCRVQGAAGPLWASVPRGSGGLSFVSSLGAWTQRCMGAWGARWPGWAGRVGVAALPLITRVDPPLGLARKLPHVPPRGVRCEGLCVLSLWPCFVLAAPPPAARTVSSFWLSQVDLPRGDGPESRQAWDPVFTPRGHVQAGTS